MSGHTSGNLRKYGRTLCSTSQANSEKTRGLICESPTSAKIYHDAPDVTWFLSCRTAKTVDLRGECSNCMYFLVYFRKRAAKTRLRGGFRRRWNRWEWWVWIERSTKADSNPPNSSGFGPTLSLKDSCKDGGSHGLEPKKVKTLMAQLGEKTTLGWKRL
jgi:hypothetical protein